jgi:hypothetical protein
LGLLFGGVGDDDSSLLDFPFFQSLEKNSVVEGCNLHENLLFLKFSSLNDALLILAEIA